MNKQVVYKYSKLLCPVCNGKVEVFQNTAHNNHHCTKCDMWFMTGAIFK